MRLTHSLPILSWRTWKFEMCTTTKIIDTTTRYQAATLHIKTTKLMPCEQHTLQSTDNGITLGSAISCSFFSEYCRETSKIIDNKHLYQPSESTSLISLYVCMSRQGPLLELVKAKKAYEKHHQQINQPIMGWHPNISIQSRLTRRWLQLTLKRVSHRQALKKIPLNRHPRLQTIKS